MMNSILNMFGGKNYGKLLLKTVSTDSNWYINFRNSQVKDFDWTMIDNVTKSVIATGRIEIGVTNKVEVDLSTSSGDCSLYIDIDNTGNGVYAFWGWYATKQITWFNIDVLPNLKTLWLNNDSNTEILIKSEVINKLEHLFFYNLKSNNADFLNNAVNSLKYFNCVIGYNKILNGVFNISQASKLEYIKSTVEMELDSCNFKLNNPLLTYVHFAKLKDNDTLQNVNINDDTTYLYLNNFKYRITSLATQTLNNLENLYLYSNSGDTYEYDQTAIIANLTGLKSATFSQIRVPANVNIDSHPNLITYNPSQLEDLQIVNINNNTKLKIINFNAVHNITDVTITDNTILDYLRIYYSGVSDYNINIDTVSKQNLTRIYIIYDKRTGEWDFSDAPALKNVYLDNNYFTKFNLKNGNNANITTFSGHTKYVDATFLVDNTTLPIFTNATFRSGDVVTDDPAAY